MAIVNSTAIEFDIEKKTFQSIALDQIALQAENNKLYWIHCNLTEANTLKQLAERLRLPENVLALCAQSDPMSQLIDTDNAITIQLEAPLSTRLDKADATQPAHLLIHLTTTFCFTASTKPIPALDEFVKSCQKTINYARTPCFILFLIIDNIINDYARILFKYEIITEEMDMRVRASHKNIYNEVMDAKQDVMKTKRYLIAIREILVRISGRKIAVISEQCQVSLYNLSNHTHMTVHEADSIRDMLNGLLDQIDNNLIQKLNETMRVLTAFASIFLPLTLITGIYGMNFHYMPELGWKYGYFIVLGFIVFCGACLLFVFKKMKWF